MPLLSVLKSISEHSKMSELINIAYRSGLRLKNVSLMFRSFPFQKVMIACLCLMYTGKFMIADTHVF